MSYNALNRIKLIVTESIKRKENKSNKKEMKEKEENKVINSI